MQLWCTQQGRAVSTPGILFWHYGLPGTVFCPCVCPYADLKHPFGPDRGEQPSQRSGPCVPHSSLVLVRDLPHANGPHRQRLLSSLGALQPDLCRGVSQGLCCSK